MTKISGPVPFDDRWVRLLLVPVLGMGIGSLSGLYYGMGPESPMFWGTTAYLTLISWVIWEGNRQCWVRLPGKPGWLENPVRRAVLLAAVNFGWTAFSSIALLLVWTGLSGQPRPDWQAIYTCTLASILCVGFFAHAYETASLIRLRRRDREANLSLELAALNAQVDPHFIYNCLNTIVELNDENPPLATEFAVNLADVYRYVVINGRRQSVSLADELGFLEKYSALLRTRFGDGILLHLPPAAPQHADLRLPPVALQVLMENAVKHNRFSESDPIEIFVSMQGRAVVVSNEKRPLSRARPGACTGLTNLDQRCKLICGPGIQVREDDAVFAVTVPLL